MATIERGDLPSDNFSMLSNAWLRDKSLSFKARGVLSWLSSHKVGFRVSLDRIAAASDHDGVAAVRSAVQELEDRGYLVRRKQRDEGGRITARAYILQDPNVQVTANMQFSHDGETPSLCEPPVENTTHGEIAPLKKNISSKKTRDEKTTGPDLTIVPGGGSTSKATRATRATRMPEGWAPTQDLILWARDKGAPSPQWVAEQTEAFTLWVEAKGTTYVKWDRGWQNWIVRKLEDLQKAPQQRRNGTTGRNFPGQGMFS